MDEAQTDRMVKEARAFLAKRVTRRELRTAARVNCQICHLEPVRYREIKSGDVKGVESAQDPTES